MPRKLELQIKDTRPTDQETETQEERLVDFGDILTASYSRIKDSPTVEWTKKVDFEEAKVENSIFDFDASGTHTVRAGTWREANTFDNKRYNFFVCPALPSTCQKLCQRYIGQGTTICVNKNCSKAHRTMGRKEEKYEMQVEQIFIQKTKGIVFVEPTMDALIDSDLKDQWNNPVH